VVQIPLWHWSDAAGVLLSSATEIVAPAPSQTFCWQSPEVPLLTNVPDGW
jgi:hypothetical protein